jgi:hypothetical protein
MRIAYGWVVGRQCDHASPGGVTSDAAREIAPVPPPPYDPRRLIYRWDLDKTYLRTEFDTVRDLLRTAFESASQKKTVPGAAALLREIRATEPAGIYILSGSPEQMRPVLEAKLRLDGIRWDDLVLKPQLKNILRGRFRFVRDQVGYKLASLLDTRAAMSPETLEYMFGDDAEADAFIYSLYADLCAGRVEMHILMRVLELAGVYPDVLPRVVRIAERVPRGGGAIRIFIHLDRVSSPAAFAEYGPRVCPFYNYFQPACVLLEHGVLPPRSVFCVAAELVTCHGFTADALVASYLDLVERKHLGRAGADALVRSVDEVDESPFAATSGVLRAFVRELDAACPRDVEAPMPPAPTAIDWVELFDRDRARARAAKLRSLGRR